MEGVTTLVWPRTERSKPRSDLVNTVMLLWVPRTGNLCYISAAEKALYNNRNFIQERTER